MVWTPKGHAAEPFHRQMKNATKDIHAVSDALVNGKLSLALSENTVWAEGLLVFYEIFKYLEEAMQRLKDKQLVSELQIEGIDRRTAAFEADLKYYLGEGWTSSYTPRESVAKYLLHLMEIEKEDPDLLIPYVYHLYMGLLSGGQILKKKRQLMNRLSFSKRKDEKGYAVTDFGNQSVYLKKKSLMAALDDIALRMDPEKKKKILEESRTVFELNNTLIRSVKGAGQVLLKKLIYFVVFIFILYMLLKMFIF